MTAISTSKVLLLIFKREIQLFILLLHQYSILYHTILKNSRALKVKNMKASFRKISGIREKHIHRKEVSSIFHFTLCK